jgi:HlyD family secretion protein
MSSRRIYTMVLIVALISVAAIAAYWRFGRAVEVTIAVAQQGMVPVRVTGPANVQARTTVSLSSRLSATLTQINVDVGDAVHSGQLLATLDDRDLSARRGVVAGQQESLLRNTEGARAALAKANADLDLARSKHRRDAELLSQGFVSEAVVDTSAAALQAAQAGVDAAKASLAARVADARTLVQEAKYSDAVASFTKIIAPLDGIVVQRLAEVGNTVIPGSPILRLIDPKTLWVATRVDESVVGRVQTGQTARIRLQTGETLPGKVVRIARQSDAATRELEVHVAFDTIPQRFAIDQQAEVTIEVGQDQGIVVPLTALTRDSNGRQGVLVVENARTRFQPVDTGAADDKQVLLSKGLKGGESVIASAKGVVANLRVKPAGSVQP